VIVSTVVNNNGVILECVPSEAAVDQLDNPTWSKVSRQARTDLDVYGGNEICKAQGKANDQP
jgi:hypothetical protein